MNPQLAPFLILFTAWRAHSHYHCWVVQTQIPAKSRSSQNPVETATGCSWLYHVSHIFIPWYIMCIPFIYCWLPLSHTKQQSFHQRHLLSRTIFRARRWRKARGTWPSSQVKLRWSSDSELQAVFTLFWKIKLMNGMDHYRWTARTARNTTEQLD